MLAERGGGRIIRSFGKCDVVSTHPESSVYLWDTMVYRPFSGGVASRLATAIYVAIIL